MDDRTRGRADGTKDPTQKALVHFFRVFLKLILILILHFFVPFPFLVTAVVVIFIVICVDVALTQGHVSFCVFFLNEEQEPLPEQG